MEEKNKINVNQKNEKNSNNMEDIKHFIKIKKVQNSVLEKIIKKINKEIR